MARTHRRRAPLSSRQRARRAPQQRRFAVALMDFIKKQFLDVLQ